MLVHWLMINCQRLVYAKPVETWFDRQRLRARPRERLKGGRRVTSDEMERERENNTVQYTTVSADTTVVN